MRCLVGLALDGHALGAVRFATWLAARGEDRLYGIHVLRRSEHWALAERALDDLAERTATTERFEVLRVVDHTDVAGALIEACDEYAADLMVLGRRAARGDPAVVRLGRVARRMLRMLPGPIAIVPPDFSSNGIPDGPVIAATDLTDDSVAPCRLAETLARRLDRSLVLAHVVPDASAWGLPLLSEGEADEITRTLCSDATKDLATWREQHGLSAQSLEPNPGDVVDALLRLGTEHRASLMVLGSRRLGPIARTFTTSVGSALAAGASWPVVVAPPALTKA
jgi:nucleotide-binding universal stress UspA family protein